MAIDCKNCKAYCCRKIGLLNKDLDRGDCVCKYLTKDNKCAIYEDRPELCNTVHIYNKYFRNRYTPEEWNNMNRQACEALRDEAEIVRKEPVLKEESKTE